MFCRSKQITIFFRVGPQEAAFNDLSNHMMASVPSTNPIYYESYNPLHLMSDQIQTLFDTEHITDETSKLENFLKQYFCCKI